MMMMRRRLVVVVVAVAALLCAARGGHCAEAEGVRMDQTQNWSVSQSDSSWWPVVKTAAGSFKGFLSSKGVYAWLGIPFAQPPVGKNRFRPPQPLAPLSSTYDAFYLKNMCPQLRLAGDVAFGKEDCLYLNVVVPDSYVPGKSDPLPVMVWIFGGGYSLGDAYEFGWYDAANSAKKRNVIMVAMNYRVGALGFLAHENFKDEQGTTGNYGIQDQRAALQWVHDNIAGFGGDPKRVTIFGESAGAFSVCVHVASPASAGLFQAAIMESGTCETIAFFQPYADASVWGDEWALHMGCDSSKLSPDDWRACMREVPAINALNAISTWNETNWPFGPSSSSLHKLPAGVASTILPPIAPVMPWGPCIDNSTEGLTDQPFNLIRSGNFNKVPMIIGTNNNEGSIFMPLMTVVARGTHYPPNASDVHLVLSHFYNASTTAAILDHYPLSAFNDSQIARLDRMMTDMFFVCPSRRVSRVLDSFDVPVFLYRFRYPLDWPEYKMLGNYHTSELCFVWDNQWPILIHDFSARDRQMADTFNTFWGNFAHSHNPNGANATAATDSWPAFTRSNEDNIILNVPTSVESAYEDSQCDFWDTTVEINW
eukprot:TRINITY_DN57499_c0_g1_i1.p1 TRINITY_DN57499_c0_g1~~TRINITY_DN57499_c0_g1_i1.p1  ORF type:complete len:595 (+),score=279.30 TRINITY_DN57499_c0_g1_i1:3-1787(+)